MRLISASAISDGPLRRAVSFCLTTKHSTAKTKSNPSGRDIRLKPCRPLSTPSTRSLDEPRWRGQMNISRFARVIGLAVAVAAMARPRLQMPRCRTGSTIRRSTASSPFSPSARIRTGRSIRNTRRRWCTYETTEAPGTVIVDTREQVPLFRPQGRHGDPLRRRRRPRGLWLVRHRARRREVRNGRPGRRRRR